MSRIDYSSSVIWIPYNSFACLSGKLRTEFTSPIAKSTSPGLTDTSFFARCWGSLVQRASTCTKSFSSPGDPTSLIINLIPIVDSDFSDFFFFLFSSVGFNLSIRFNLVTSIKIISLMFLMHSFPKWWHHLTEQFYDFFCCTSTFVLENTVPDFWIFLIHF